MELTVKQVAELVIKQLSGNRDGTEQLGIKFEDAELLVIQAKAALIEQEYKNSARGNHTPEISTGWCQRYKQPVLFDEEVGEYYSDLPAHVVDLPDDNGIQVIAPFQDKSNAFIKSSEVSEQLFAENNETKCRFKPSVNKVYFKNLPIALQKDGFVFMLLVPEDDGTMPKAKAIQVQQIVMDLLKGKPKVKDKIISQNDETIQDAQSPGKSA